MNTFETKKVTIEAVQWNGGCLSEAQEFCKDNDLPCFNVGSLKGMTGLIIPTLEGDHVAQKGDYIIKGLKGEYYPCKPDIFNMKYVEIE